MSRPRVGVDLDGVVYQFTEAAETLLAQKFGYTEFPPAESWNYLREGIDPKHWDWLWGEGMQALYSTGYPFPDAPAALQKLSRIAEIVAVTSRPKRAETVTLSWLSLFALPFHEVYVVGWPTPKSSVLCDLYVDDGPHVVCELLENTQARVLLFDRPWNRNDIIMPPLNAVSRFARVNSWEQVMEHVVGLG